MSTILKSILAPQNKSIFNIQTHAAGPAGKLPLSAEQLKNSPSGDIFGLSQNVGMGWSPAEMGRKEFLLLSTLGGIRDEDGKPIALGYHTGHWEIGILQRAAAEEIRAQGAIPFAGFWIVHFLKCHRTGKLHRTRLPNRCGPAIGSDRF